jgi:hypothetical protein
MAQNEESGGIGDRTILALVSPVIVAAGFFIFPFVPAISVYLDRRSRTYTAAASVLIGCAALPALLGAHYLSIGVFIAVSTAAAYILTHIKVPFTTGLVGSAAGGVLGAVIMLGILGAGFDRPLNEAAAGMLCNQLSAGNPEMLSYLAGYFKSADQGNYPSLMSSLLNPASVSQLVSGLSIPAQIDIVRPILEQICEAYIPALALVGGMFTGALGYYLPVLALDRRRLRLAAAQPEGGEGGGPAPVPPFAAFKIPKYIVVSLLLLEIVSSLLLTGDSSGMVALSAASSMLFSTLMTVQALAMLSFFLNRRKVAAALQFLLLALAVLLLSWLLPYIGIFDALFDMRAVALRMEAIRAKGKQVFTQEGLDELRKMEQQRKSGKNGKDGENGKNGGEGGDK